MARYIDADALKLDIDLSKGASVLDMAISVIKAVKDAPTADVVEVVRCKDCAHYIGGMCYVTNRSPMFKYNVNIHSRKEYDYCSYGERGERR